MNRIRLDRSGGRRAAALTALAIALAGCASHAPAESGKTIPANTNGGEPSAPKEVRLKTTDGWTIIGDRYDPKGKAKGAVVLLHQRGSSATDWQPLCEGLQQAGFVALAIDQRGAGRSTQGPGPTGSDAPWPTSPDIAAALESVKTVGPVGLAGASYGANNALIYAAAHPTQVKAVALFSPGANYHGLNTLKPARAYRGALVIYHARNDSIAGDGPQQIEAASPSKNHALRLYDGDGHGTALLPDATEDAVKFFKSNLK